MKYLILIQEWFYRLLIPSAIVVVISLSNSLINYHLSEYHPEFSHSDRKELYKALLRTHRHISRQEAELLTHAFSDWGENFVIDPWLLAAIGSVESSLKENSVSSIGAIGIMQINPSFWARSCPNFENDPYQNVYCGAMIFAQYIDQCGSHSAALRCYNLGPSGALKPSFKLAGDRYMHRVMDRYELLRGKDLADTVRIASL